MELNPQYLLRYDEMALWNEQEQQIDLGASLTVVVERDPATGIFIALFAQFPETYAQGVTPHEATINVAKALTALWELEQQEKEGGVVMNMPAGTSKRHVKLQLQA